MYYVILGVISGWMLALLSGTIIESLILGRASMLIDVINVNSTITEFHIGGREPFMNIKNNISGTNLYDYFQIKITQRVRTKQEVCKYKTMGHLSI
jgi:hypothetical protein